MRWLVEVIALGKTETESLQVDAESWQKALQAARSQRGESAPMSGFSIELLDNGCRAVDPKSRLRYDVRRAPDDPPTPSVRPPSAQPPSRSASETPGQPPASQATPRLSQPAPASQPPRASRSPHASKRASPSEAPAGASIPQPSPAAVHSVVASAPVADVVAAPLAPIAGPAASTPRIDAGLGVPSQIISKREQDATDSMPLTYREYVFLVPAGTTEEAAEALLRSQLELVLASLARMPAGKLVNLGVFDVAFKGKPSMPPLSTLMWKDWRGTPTIEFPRRQGYVPRGSAPPPAAVSQPPVPIRHEPEPPVRASQASTAPPIPRAAANPAGSAAAPAVAAAAPAAVVTSAPAPAPVVASAPAPAPVISPAPAPAPIIAPAPAPVSAPAEVVAPVVGPAPVIAPAFAIAPAPSVPAAVVTQEPVLVGGPSLPTPSDSAVAATRQRLAVPERRARVRGEELIADLFESMHELHFLRDAIEGGDFCLNLAMEKIPSQAGIVHLYDIDRREFLVTSTRGPAASALLLRRHPEADVLLWSAMGKRRAMVLADAAQSDAASLDRYVVLGGLRSLIVAPVMQSGRFLGAIELLNPLDGQPFTEAEGNAMTYIAEQFAEFVASRGIVTDPARISSRPS